MCEIFGFHNIVEDYEMGYYIVWRG